MPARTRFHSLTRHASPRHPFSLRRVVDGKKIRVLSKTGEALA
jgi:hypothetical protein